MKKSFPLQSLTRNPSSLKTTRPNEKIQTFATSSFGRITLVVFRFSWFPSPRIPACFTRRSLINAWTFLRSRSPMWDVKPAMSAARANPHGIPNQNNAMKNLARYIPIRIPNHSVLTDVNKRIWQELATKKLVTLNRLRSFLCNSPRWNLQTPSFLHSLHKAIPQKLHR